jgi:DNA-binding XRE family transcriptional regulator
MANTTNEQANLSPETVDLREDEGFRRQMLIAKFVATNEEDKERSQYDLVYALVCERLRQKVTQMEMARRMDTKSPTLARMEHGGRDPKMSTLQKYAAKLGKRIVWSFEDL